MFYTVLYLMLHLGDILKNSLTYSVVEDLLIGGLV